MGNDSKQKHSLSTVTAGLKHLYEQDAPANILAKFTMAERLEETEFNALIQSKLISRYPKFRSYISMEDSCWLESTQGNQAEDHVEYLQFTVSSQNDRHIQINKFISSIITEKFKAKHSPWSVQVISFKQGKEKKKSESKSTSSDYAEGCVVLFKISHVLGDGVTLTCLMSELCVPADKNASFFENAHKWKQKLENMMKRSWWEHLLQGLFLLCSFFLYVLYVLSLPLTSDSVSCLTSRRDQFSLDKTSAFSREALSLSAVKQSCQKLGEKMNIKFSVNDCFLSAVGAALAQYVEEYEGEHGGKPSALKRLLCCGKKNNNSTIGENSASRMRVLCVYNTRGVFSQKDCERILLDYNNPSYDCNSFSYLIPTLCTRPKLSTLRRLCITQHEMHGIKNSPLPLVVTLVNNFMWKWLGGWLTAKIAVSTQQAMTAFVSNVPGPQLPLTMCGKRVLRIVNTVSPVALPMGISLLSYDGKLEVGVTTDALACEEPQRIVDLIHLHWDNILLTAAE